MALCGAKMFDLTQLAAARTMASSNRRVWSGNPAKEILLSAPLRVVTAGGTRFRGVCFNSPMYGIYMNKYMNIT